MMIDDDDALDAGEALAVARSPYARVAREAFDPTPVVLYPGLGQVADAIEALWPREARALVLAARAAGIEARMTVSMASTPRRGAAAVLVTSVCARLGAAGWRAWACWRDGAFEAAQLWRADEELPVALGVRALRAWVSGGGRS